MKKYFNIFYNKKKGLSIVKLKFAIPNFKPYSKLYIPITFDDNSKPELKNIRFSNKYRNYTFTQNMLNHIYAHWQILNGEKRIRKVGKIIDGKFYFEIDNGDRLTKKEIAELKDFLEKKLNKVEENLQYIKLSKTNNREEWLQQRKLGIGGSDLGAILGLSKWSNPYKLWLEKTGNSEIIEDKSKERMFDIGNHNEELVAKYFSEDENKKVKIEPCTLQNKKYPFMLANIDRWIVGENAGLECKTTRNFNLKKDLEKGVVPLQYQLQCLHYMAVTGADCWYISILDMISLKLYTFKIDRNEELIEMIIEKEKTFWDLVENKIEPEISIDGDSETTKRLMGLNLKNDDEIVIFDETNFKLLDSLDEQIKDLEKQKEKLKQQILKDMEGNSKATSENYKIEIKETTRNTFDKKKLFELVEISEEIKEKCNKTSTSKTLKIKKI